MAVGSLHVRRLSHRRFRRSDCGVRAVGHSFILGCISPISISRGLSGYSRSGVVVRGDSHHARLGSAPTNFYSSVSEYLPLYIGQLLPEEIREGRLVASSADGYLG